MRRRTLMQGSIDISSAVVSASNSTYSGTAKTPTVTVTLNGNVVPSSGYDVAYSDNTNAGTATITVTGKGDYEGTTTGSFTISPKALSITASNQTITYGSSISQSTSRVSTSGLVSGDSLTSITLSQSTTSVTTSGTITPSNAQTTKGISNYSVSYYTGTLIIYKATGSVSFNTKTCSVGYDGGTTGTLYVRTTGSGWVKTSDKTVSGYNVYKSVSNYHVKSSYSVFKLTFVNSTGASVSTTLKLGPATESGCDFSYIATWNAADITSYTVPSTTLGKVTAISPEWTDVSVTIPTGTNTLQIVYRKDSSVNKSPDCGYVAIPYDISFGTISINKPVIIGDGTVTWSSSNTSAVSVNSSTGLLTVNEVGTATITASMAAGTNYTAASDTFTITVDSFMPIGCTVNFAYTGSVQYRTLSAGQYKLQCWGARGGSNAAYSSYSITAQSGGKGGYSEGVLTVTSPRTLYVFVGGQGSSSGNGGWNGGGGGNGTTQYNANNTFGYTKVGCGGGATDIALTTSSMGYSSYRTNRSSASYLSRIIVAGGGSGGAMSYTAVTTSTTTTTLSLAAADLDPYSHVEYINNGVWATATDHTSTLIPMTSYRGQSFTVTPSSTNIYMTFLAAGPSLGNAPSYATGWGAPQMSSSAVSGTVPSNATYMYLTEWDGANNRERPKSITCTQTTSSTTTSNNSSTGKVGGGTSGGGSYSGSQSSAGSGGGFGYGANQRATGNRYHAGLGGGGWYGGGSLTSDSSPSSYIGYSGGGSGWVNIAANAGNRPSGYTGIELDSGTTYAGNTSFPSTSGGTETGHSGNGYAKITRLS